MHFKPYSLTLQGFEIKYEFYFLNYLEFFHESNGEFV